MSWIKQGNQYYYYRVIWEDHRLKSVYVGRGAEAEALAAQDAEQAARRRAASDTHAAQRDLAASIDEAATSLSHLVQALHDASMLLAGYHYSDSKWTRLRENWLMSVKKKGPAAGSNAPLSLPGTGDAGFVSVLKSTLRAERSRFSPDHLATLIELVGRIDMNKPGPDDLTRLEQMLASNPGLWRAVADFAALTIASMAEQASLSPSARLAFVKGAQELHARILDAGNSPLESVVAEQVAVCWVRLRVFEAWLTNATGLKDEAAIRFWDARVTGAQHRYLAACESLARIRRLAALTPQLVQINVGGQQINVAQSGAAALSEGETDEVLQLPGKT